MPHQPVRGTWERQKFPAGKLRLASLVSNISWWHSTSIHTSSMGKKTSIWYHCHCWPWSNLFWWWCSTTSCSIFLYDDFSCSHDRHSLLFMGKQFHNLRDPTVSTISLILSILDFIPNHLTLPQIARTKERFEWVGTARSRGNGSEEATPKEEKQQQLPVGSTILERCRH